MNQRITRRDATKIIGAGALAFSALGDIGRAEAPTIPSPLDPHPRKRVKVLGSEMSYVDVGEGDPIVFLHGNPTWSYLWRNVISGMKGEGRLLAPDLIGMGESDKLPGHPYHFVDHARYLDAWFEATGVTKNVTLVLHDWGTALGFNYATRHPERIRAIAHMEAILTDRTWAEFGPFENTFRTLRTPQGESLVLDHNFFVEQVLPHAVLRGLTAEEMGNYRKPFPTRDSRWPTLIFPREIPVNGEPRDVALIVAESGRWLQSTKIPKAFINVVPGTISPQARAFAAALPNTKEVTVKGIHYVQEDSPNDIVAAVRDVLKRT